MAAIFIDSLLDNTGNTKEGFMKPFLLICKLCFSDIKSLDTGHMVLGSTKNVLSKTCFIQSVSWENERAEDSSTRKQVEVGVALSGF